MLRMPQFLTALVLISIDLILLPGGMPGATTLGDGDILESMVKKHADEGQPYARFRVAPAVAFGSWGLMHGFAFWFDVE